MLSTEQINDLHRLYWSERWPIRKIERHLRMGWHTIRKYLDAPAQGPATRPRTSKLDPFKPTIAEWLEKDATVTGTVIEQRLRPLGYRGGPTILCDYLKKARPQAKPSRVFIRMEPSPGERFEVDWGHFGVLDYSGDQRKLYAFALVEAHSRMLYLEFTHSQSFETFVRCHMHAFVVLGGVAREIAYDNLATAVAEHDGRLVRFLPRFLAFAREYGFYPRACNVAAGWEKGKVERAIGYTRQNFWPLREFTDLNDVNRQARQWLSEVANQRPASRDPAAAHRPLSTHRAETTAGHSLRLPRQRRTARAQRSSCAVRRQPLLRAPTPCGPPLDGQSRFQFRHERLSRSMRVRATRVPGGVAKPSARIVSKPSWPISSRCQKVACAGAPVPVSRRSLFQGDGGSVSARHRRHRPRALAPTHRTARTDPTVRAGIRGQRY